MPDDDPIARMEREIVEALSEEIEATRDLSERVQKAIDDLRKKEAT